MSNLGFTLKVASRKFTSRLYDWLISAAGQLLVNFRTLDLNLLRVFDAVMAERNLTRAAARLAMTQPAVSSALKRLRGSVGEELLTRTAYGVKPTPMAEALWPEVRAALGRLQSVLDPGSFDPVADSVTFQLAMADATAAMLMPPLISEIERARALVNLRVIPLSTRDPRELLVRGDIHCAVGYFPEAIAALMAQGPASQLRHARLYESDYVLVMRKGHPLAAAPIDLDTFCAAHHLLTSFSGRAHGFVDQALAEDRAFASSRAHRQSVLHGRPGRCAVRS